MSLKKRKITIIRSAVGCLSAMALIKELKRRNVKVIGTDCSPLSAGLYMCDRGYVIPRGDDPRFMDVILGICDIEKPNAILSGPEEEMLVISKNKRLFESRNVLALCPDYDTVKLCANKMEAYEMFRRYDIPTPEIYDIDSVEFPCVIKPKFGRGGRAIHKVNNADELEFYLKKVKDPIIQEFIDGTEYTVDTFADLNGRLLSIVPRIRLQTESGISVRSMTVHDREIIQKCKTLVRKLKLIGPSAIQCIRKGRSTKFIEINTRFGGGSILSIKADPSIVTNLMKIVQGKRPTPSRGFREGLVMIRYYSELFLPKRKLLKQSVLPK
jgi:carbamoyl-phosphate synthase large subunit